MARFRLSFNDGLDKGKNMEIFVDSANLDDIRFAQKLGMCDGVTTNPTLIAREHKPFHQAIRDICELVSGPVSAEVISLDFESMLAEAKELAQLAPNVVVKIPMTEDGLRAVHALTALGIKTNVTLIFSASQAILAAKAGATYVSPFVGRLDDISHAGVDIVADIIDIFSNYPSIQTKVLVASIRNPLHFVDCARMGADAFTAPSKVIAQMAKHPLTDTGLAQFIADSKKFEK